MSEEKYGFVYIWRDRKHNRFYIGCHWGTENDGYICSSNWMRDAFRRRPEDFKRRIIKKIYTTRKDTFLAEDHYLQMIKKEELKLRYYNISNSIKDHWSQYPDKIKSISDKAKNKVLSEETKQKIRNARAKQVFSPESKEKKRQSMIKRYQDPTEREKTSKALMGRLVSQETRNKISKSLEKHEVSELSRIRSSEVHKGHKYNIGRKHTEETKRKISETKKLKNY